MQRDVAANLHEVSPSITSQNRQGLAGYMLNCIMGYSADQLQPCVVVQYLAVRKQSRVLWPLHPCLYACQEPCTHHIILHAYKADRALQSCRILSVVFVLPHIIPTQGILPCARQTELSRPCLFVKATCLVFKGCQSVHSSLQTLESCPIFHKANDQ